MGFGGLCFFDGGGDAGFDGAETSVEGCGGLLLGDVAGSSFEAASSLSSSISE